MYYRGDKIRCYCYSLDSNNSYSASQQLLVISMHNQLSMEQKWCLFKQTRLFAPNLP